MSVDYVMLENVPEAWTHQQYHVRQYRPNYFSGYENEVVRNIPFDDILKCSWFKNFEQHGFEHFSFSQYGDELLISAHYKNGEHWVAGFAVPIDKDLAEDWRYYRQAGGEMNTLDGIALRLFRDRRWQSIEIGHTDHLLDDEIDQLSWADKLATMLANDPRWKRMPHGWARRRPEDK